ncbi:dTDP-3-amino-3,6-dideoxy-alpha-D-glucopyranose N,N-dimethyltransferase [Lacunisphaera limnophila]|uniref:dTDP-3-amino-3,6-dideoxy-alpha-D-glucopyranose N,N-dimethyltransferase n=1 Tax=Lacunisphaera limnophila TaxID=1838286 RepID=A0A1D8AYJ6_9BACT|nr:class I SAM-dependent methyltransferase [Lacunisphaera limnophila]AOS45966.1 dTDP-3-amino-3,6-dideoxy-alpha-D-glucopyranose N,N-dimethyltransferase [Lacunisphaera limnophila]
MKPTEVAKSYDALAARWASPAFDLANGIEPHRRALRLAPTRGAALDVGCGANGRILQLLQAHGLDVEGLDISAEMLRLAREAHPGVTFHQGDICSWCPPQRYVFISAWDSIWHVPLAEQRGVLLKLLSALAPAGVLIFTAGGLAHPDERTDQAMGVPMYHATLGVPHLLDVVHEGACILRHFEYDQWPELHVYAIVQKAESNPFRSPVLALLPPVEQIPGTRI